LFRRFIEILQRRIVKKIEWNMRVKSCELAIDCFATEVNDAEINLEE